MKNTVKVAVTGGIGSGKSTVINALKKAGYFTVSCDEIVNELYCKNSVKRKLKKIFPRAIAGVLRLKADRKIISEEAFKDKELLEKLNGLLHPAIIAECFKRAEKFGGKIAFIEIPLLFECGQEKAFDFVIVVMRDVNARIESVKLRSSLTREEIEARIKNQVDYELLDTSGYKVIVNDGDEAALSEKAVNACKEIFGEINR